MSVGIIGGNAAAISVVSVTFDPASVAANTSAAQSITVPGVLVGDVVHVNKPSTTAGLSIGGSRVSAADTVSVTFVNSTAGAIDAGSEVYLIAVIRPEGQAAASRVLT